MTEEQRLFDLSHQYKQKARTLKAKREEEERLERAANTNRILRERRLKEEAEAAEKKIERDFRVRDGLIRASAIIKTNSLAFQGPATSLDGRKNMPSFGIVDIKTGERITIYVNATGFEWD